jgi:hypothetical protein
MKKLPIQSCVTSKNYLMGVKIVVAHYFISMLPIFGQNIIGVKNLWTPLVVAYQWRSCRVARYHFCGPRRPGLTQKRVVWPTVLCRWCVSCQQRSPVGQTTDLSTWSTNENHSIGPTHVSHTTRSHLSHSLPLIPPPRPPHHHQNVANLLEPMNQSHACMTLASTNPSNIY